MVRWGWGVFCLFASLLSTCTSTQVAESLDWLDGSSFDLVDAATAGDVLNRADAFDEQDTEHDWDVCTLLASSHPCQECRLCGAEQVCRPVAVGTSCDDSNCCTLEDQCQPCNPQGADCPDIGLRCAGTPRECQPSTVCRVSICECVEGQPDCMESLLQDGRGCEFDPSLCTADYCLGGICVQGASYVEDDGEPCTVEACVGGTIQVELRTSGSCDDKDLCTENDTCVDGVCVGTPNLRCPAKCGDGLCDSWETGESCLVDCPAQCGDGLCVEAVESHKNCPQDCPPMCEDGYCGPGESVFTCPSDCPPACGNGVCEPLEGVGLCPADCGWCGDGICGIAEGAGGGIGCPRDCMAACGDKKCVGGESPESCCVDCGGCGDGFCGLHEGPLACPSDCPASCGNGACEWGEDILICTVDCLPTCGDTACEYPENPFSCPQDCSMCGDGVCTLPEAQSGACAKDCSTVCGDGLCEGGEDYQECAIDCGFCGDGTCGWFESRLLCPQDCDFDCGDGLCAGTESEGNCPLDCLPDVDLDGVDGAKDNCPRTTNPQQEDLDDDGQGDACDTDDDNDGYPDAADNCPWMLNVGQENLDGDEWGDGCDEDIDGDGTANEADCGPSDATSYPGAQDDCDGKDSDCDGAPDNAAVPCPGPQEICIGGACVPCHPECTGRVCGPDGCGGTCGLCPWSDQNCEAGACVTACLHDCDGEVLVPAGTFWMGCNPAREGLLQCAGNEKPYHRVDLDGYFMDKTEITVEAFGTCVAAGACDAPSTSHAYCNWNVPGKESNPVNCLTWHQARVYCAWAGKRLPTEAEWEKGARGGCERNGGVSLCQAQSRYYPWGNEWTDCVAAVDVNNSGVCGGKGTLNVCSKSPVGDSPYGLCDMSGNVWELVADFYGSFSAEPSLNPVGPAIGSARVKRGSSFAFWEGFLTFRSALAPDAFAFDTGFRCARTCTPDCTGASCGDDGCGGTCGECIGLQDQCVAGQCICEPNCDAMECGDDGCGSTCGACSTGGACVSGQCLFLCGNGYCGDPGEDCVVCPADCGSCCPNGVCDHGESCESCQSDCGPCSGLTPGFAFIPAGSFWMGTPVGCPGPVGYPGPCVQESGRLFSNESLHYVSLTHAFEMKETEVTQGEWKSTFGGWNPSYFTGCGDTCPVEQVNWYESAAYANELSLAANKTPCYSFADVVCRQAGSPANSTDYAFCMNAEHAGIDSATVTLNGVATPYDCEGYRLPTESEWEYAYRAGGTTTFYTSDGNDGSYMGDMGALDPNLDRIAWYAMNSKALYSGAVWFPDGTGEGTDIGPQEVGAKAANGWGLKDMGGNVREPTTDWAPVAPTGTMVAPIVDPYGSEPQNALRGGSWVDLADLCRGGGERILVSDKALRSYSCGIRLARSIAGSCVPNCSGRLCGEDGCGGICGTCPGTRAICMDGQCFCHPDCGGNACGDDGCGGSCGTCSAVGSCLDGSCCEPATSSDGETAPDETGLVWVSIPSGCFRMGWSPDQAEAYIPEDESVAHAVTLSPFEILETEVTESQYEAVMGGNPSANANGAGGPDHPVENITWAELDAYCDAIGGRLCTEAEWEYAARGGTTTRYTCGHDASCLEAIAWYSPNSSKMKHEVGTKAPNGYGLYDMLGNVAEWTGDWYQWDYYSVSPSVDPPGPVGSDFGVKVIRGGSFDWGASVSTRRYAVTANQNLGGRCCR